MKKYLFIIVLSVLFLTSCGSYNVKLGKNCIDNNQGGQDWSYFWFYQKGVKFNECNIKKGGNMT